MTPDDRKSLSIHSSRSSRRGSRGSSTVSTSSTANGQRRRPAQHRRPRAARRGAGPDRLPKFSPSVRGAAVVTDRPHGPKGRSDTLAPVGADGGAVRLVRVWKIPAKVAGRALAGITQVSAETVHAVEGGVARRVHGATAERVSPSPCVLTGTRAGRPNAKLRAVAAALSA